MKIRNRGKTKFCISCRPHKIGNEFIASMYNVIMYNRQKRKKEIIFWCEQFITTLATRCFYRRTRKTANVPSEFGKRTKEQKNEMREILNLPCNYHGILTSVHKTVCYMVFCLRHWPKMRNNWNNWTTNKIVTNQIGNVGKKWIVT